MCRGPIGAREDTVATVAFLDVFLHERLLIK